MWASTPAHLPSQLAPAALPLRRAPSPARSFASGRGFQPRPIPSHPRPSRREGKIIAQGETLGTGPIFTKNNVRGAAALNPAKTVGSESSIVIRSRGSAVMGTVCAGKAEILCKKQGTAISIQRERAEAGRRDSNHSGPGTASPAHFVSGGISEAAPQPRRGVRRAEYRSIVLTPAEAG